jgi:GH25 family lysozyme M1 (1,4-beta-N-acetylmuramidase)
MTPKVYTVQFTGQPDATTAALIAWLAQRGYRDQITETLTRMTFAQPVRLALQPGDPGHDASRHNWPLDAAAAAAAGQRFAYLRATMGLPGSGFTGLDDRYSAHRANHQAAGFLLGAYHYFVWNLDGTAQAEHFLAAAGEGLELPECVDVEPRESDTEDVVDKAISTANLAAFISRVQAVRRRVTVVYTNPSAWARMTTQPAWLRQQLLWLADWTPPATLRVPPHAAFVWMHQYKVAEIGELPWHPHGRLDLNRFLGDTPQRPRPPEHTLRDKTNQQVINLFDRVFGREAYFGQLSLALGAYLAPALATRAALYTGPAVEVMPLPAADRAALLAALP